MTEIENRLFLKNMNILKSLDYKNNQKIYDVFKDDSRYYIITEIL